MSLSHAGQFGTFNPYETHPDRSFQFSKAKWSAHDEYSDDPLYNPPRHAQRHHNQPIQEHSTEPSMKGDKNYDSKDYYLPNLSQPPPPYSPYDFHPDTHTARHSSQDYPAHPVPNYIPPPLPMPSPPTRAECAVFSLAQNTALSLYQEVRKRVLITVLGKVEHFKHSGMQVHKVEEYMRKKAKEKWIYNYGTERDVLVLKVLVQVLYEELEKALRNWANKEIPSSMQPIEDPINQKLPDPKFLSHMKKELEIAAAEQNVRISMEASSLRKEIEGQSKNIADLADQISFKEKLIRRLRTDIDLHQTAFTILEALVKQIAYIVPPAMSSPDLDLILTHLSCLIKWAKDYCREDEWTYLHDADWIKRKEKEKRDLITEGKLLASKQRPPVTPPSSDPSDLIVEITLPPDDSVWKYCKQKYTDDKGNQRVPFGNVSKSIQNRGEIDRRKSIGKMQNGGGKEADKVGQERDSSAGGMGKKGSKASSVEMLMSDRGDFDSKFSSLQKDDLVDLCLQMSEKMNEMRTQMQNLKDTCSHLEREREKEKIAAGRKKSSQIQVVEKIVEKEVHVGKSLESQRENEIIRNALETKIRELELSLKASKDETSILKSTIDALRTQNQVQTEAIEHMQKLIKSPPSSERPVPTSLHSNTSQPSPSPLHPQQPPLSAPKSRPKSDSLRAPPPQIPSLDLPTHPLHSADTPPLSYQNMIDLQSAQRAAEEAERMAKIYSLRIGELEDELLGINTKIESVQLENDALRQRIKDIGPGQVQVNHGGKSPKSGHGLLINQEEMLNMLAVQAAVIDKCFNLPKDRLQEYS